METSITNSMFQPIQRIPPDGGYGWAIVIAYAIANLIVIPTITSFGLIFKDKFTEMNVPAADLTFIINLNAAFAMSLGFLNGPLLRTFGYRKISVVAALFFTIGLTMTAFASSVVDFIITYGLITAVGYGLSNSSFALALNSYFRERRNKAAGIAMTLTGIGPIIYPPLINYLLGTYGVTGCMLFIAGLAAHMLVAAALLQPIEWHLISIAEDQEMAFMGKSIPQITREPCSANNIRMPTVTSIASMGRYDSFIFPEFPKVNSGFEFSSEEEVTSYMERCPTKNQLVLDHDIDAQSIYGFDQLAPVRNRTALLPDQISIARNFSRRTLCPNSFILPTQTSPMAMPTATSIGQSASQTTFGTNQLPPPTGNKLRWYESGSLDSIHLGSSAEIFKEIPAQPTSTGKRRRSSILAPFRRQSLIMHVLKKNILSSSPEQDDDEAGNERDRTAHKDSQEEQAERKPLAVATTSTNSTIDEKHSVCCQSLGRWLVRFFDLDLLRDKIYLNMMLGMSIAIFAEMNFAALTPFILSDLEYTNNEIASILSIIALADLIARFLSPFIADHFACSVRATFIASLLLMILTRSGFLFANTYGDMVIVAVAMGIAKGIRTVYMSLVIPSYIPIERLASASGIQMFTNGIFLLLLGPVLVICLLDIILFSQLSGLIKDWTGSYAHCIIFLNIVTLTTVIMYSIEMFYNRNKNKDDDDYVDGSEIRPVS